MIQLNLRRIEGHAVPMDPLSAQRLTSLPNYTEFVAHVHVARNVRQNAQMHAMLKLVADNCPEYPTPESLRRFLQLRTHMFETIIKKDEPIIIRQKLDFADMDQIEFTEVFGAWTRVICEEVIPGMVPAELQAEVWGSL